MTTPINIVEVSDNLNCLKIGTTTIELSHNETVQLFENVESFLEVQSSKQDEEYCEGEYREDELEEAAQPSYHL